VKRTAWDIRLALWKSRATYEGKVISHFMSPEGARARRSGSSPHPERLVSLTSPECARSPQMLSFVAAFNRK
jgi:hypothetical protein